MCPYRTLVVIGYSGSPIMPSHPYPTRPNYKTPQTNLDPASETLHQKYSHRQDSQTLNLAKPYSNPQHLQNPEDKPPKPQTRKNIHGEDPPGRRSSASGALRAEAAVVDVGSRERPGLESRTYRFRGFRAWGFLTLRVRLMIGLMSYKVSG